MRHLRDEAFFVRVALSADGAVLVSLHEDARVSVWDVATGEVVAAGRLGSLMLRPGRHANFALAVTPNGGTFAATAGGMVEFASWDGLASRLMFTPLYHGSEAVMAGPAVFFAGDG